MRKSSRQPNPPAGGWGFHVTIKNKIYTHEYDKNSEGSNQS